MLSTLLATLAVCISTLALSEARQARRAAARKAPGATTLIYRNPTHGRQLPPLPSESNPLALPVERYSTNYLDALSKRRGN